MVQRIVLHYYPGSSLLHRWDARCKFIGLLMVTATLLQTKTLWFILHSGLLLGLLGLSRLPLKQFLRDLGGWVIFLFILFLFQAFLTPGPKFSTFSWLPVSKEGLHLAISSCWRLGLLLGYTVLFTAVTRPRELQDALVWFLKPFPFLPGRGMGLMVSLTLRFFSTILDQAEEVKLAHKARQGDRSRNPFRKARFLGIPLLRRSLFRAEEMTLALFARGYRDDIPVRLPKLRPSHLIPLPILFAFFLVLWFLSTMQL